MGIVALRGPAIGMTLGHEYGTLRAVVRRRPLIVAPVDGSADGNTTVDYALALAGRRGADVDLLHVVRPRGPSVFDNPDIALVGQTSSSRHVADPSDERALLERPTVTVGPEGTHIRNVTYKGEPGKAIAAYAQLSEAAAIIIGKYYGSPRWRRSGNIAVSLGRSAPIPVLIVPPPMDGDPVTAAAPFAHIVSAADFTVSSAVALRAALDIARASGGRVTLVHAMKDTPGRMVFSGFEALGAIDEIHAKAAKVAARLRRAIPASAAGRVDSRVTTGEPQRGILDVAAQVDADLIVIGVPPRSRFDEVLFGSTLRGVVRRASCPVLVVPVIAGAHQWIVGATS